MDISLQLQKIAADLSKVAGATEWTRELDKAQTAYMERLVPFIEHYVESMYQRHGGKGDPLSSGALYVDTTISGLQLSGTDVDLMVEFGGAHRTQLDIFGIVSGSRVKERLDPSRLGAAKIAKRITELVIDAVV
tara:strand:- start:41141 stop:41542 length:402 start_codon:yes stop_codon:yes gene_type:complete